MDEMTQLRELRADAPLPGRAALAPGRALLTGAITGRNRRARGLRADWRVASLGAVVAIAAAALFITQVVDTPAPRPSAPATVAGDLDLSSPATALGRAADYLDRQEVPPEPRPDQWIYLREVGGVPAQPTRKDGAEPEVKGTMEVPDPAPSWIPYDDKAAEGDESDTDYRTARESYRIAAGLPEDPEALLAELRKVFPTGSGPDGPPEAKDEHSFRALSVLLQSYPLPPDALARIYRAMATVDGVEVTDHLIRDASGRQVIAVTRQYDGQDIRREILIDPVDYGYAGQREVVTRTHDVSTPGGLDPTMVYKRGDLLIDGARTKAAVVDAKGQKP
ncbi:CU044_5270 family protein [Streptomyces anulatus]|uniref:CU044_5270 family protein n=1 Tax=Streptomyces anulatus TaxID=1892 RepID=UPI002254C049|nr:CU044_5270 family protein [Streptomyces anulatus]MCX4520603.1 CU044_5270 family protein [Streptomyces anulatus]MCX4603472.1 CU044_5270 family protein [Streptomyces anulatus]